MKGFIAAVLIICAAVGFVIGSSLYISNEIGYIYGEVEGERFQTASDEFDKLVPFLSLCAPDEAVKEVMLAFSDAQRGGSEKEKCRLMLSLESLRRQVGLCPASIS